MNDAARILMVDDEPNVLAAFRRTLGRTLPITCADGGAAALDAIRAGPFAVVVTDMSMPGMNGVQFLNAARPLARESVFVMLTGNADQQTAALAINTAGVFRFLNKPCPNDQLEAAVRAALRQHDVQSAERTLLRETVAGSVRLLGDALEVSSPVAMAYVSSVKRTVAGLCHQLSIPTDWQLPIAASVSLIGLITIPGLTPGADINDEQLALAAAVGGRLVGHIPRLAGVAAMVQRQREPGDLPADLTALAAADLERAGAQLLRFAVDLARAERRVGSRRDALATLAMLRQHDARLVAAARAADGGGDAAAAIPTLRLSLAQLAPGMVVVEDVRTAANTLLLSGGQALSDVSIACLLNFAQRGQVGPTVTVRNEPLAQAA